MSLPTRADFLATGLVPAENSTDECPICTEPMDSPVKLPCSHVFCRNCISHWLQQPATSTCAMCRQVLFTTGQASGPAVPDASRVRHAQAIRALRTSGLAHASTAGTPFPDNAPFSNVETFDASIPLDRAQLARRSAARAFEIVASNRIPRTTGTVRFQANTLGTNLIAMANMLKHMSSQLARQRPYVAAGNPWAQISIAVWEILSPKQGLE